VFEALFRLLSKKYSKEHYPGVPDPTEDVESLYRTVIALKMGFEQLTRTRGKTGKSAFLVEELDLLAAALLPLLDERYITEIGEPDDSTLDAHLADIGIHFPDAPADDLWGRREGEWERIPTAVATEIDWRDIIDDAARVLVKTWSSERLTQLFDAVDAALLAHTSRTDNPHAVMHDQLTDITTDQHHKRDPLLELTAVDYTILSAEDEIIVTCTNVSPITITLPLLVSTQRVGVVRAGKGAVTIDGAGALITGEPMQMLPLQYDSASLFAAGTEWVLI
jgi:hypothetical protein